MIFEKNCAVFNPLELPLASVEAGQTVEGAPIDFQFANQMVESNQVLEVFVAKGATAGQTVTPAVPPVPAVAKLVTLAVTAAPSSSGNVAVAGVAIALDHTAHTTAALTAAAIAAGNYASVGWTAVQGENADAAKVFFTAAAAGVKEDLVFADTGTTSAAATATTTREGADLIAGTPEISVPHAPTLQIKVSTSDDGENFTVVQSGVVLALADLAEGATVHKAALPDNCKKIVRVDLANDSADDFTGGSVVGVVRPL